MIELIGSEIDTLHKLWKFGPQEDGDLPSKVGMSGLIDKGLAGKDYKYDLSNFITPNGIRAASARFN